MFNRPGVSEILVLEGRVTVNLFGLKMSRGGGGIIVGFKIVPTQFIHIQYLIRFRHNEITE